MKMFRLMTCSTAACCTSQWMPEQPHRLGWECAFLFQIPNLNLTSLLPSLTSHIPHSFCDCICSPVRLHSLSFIAIEAVLDRMAPKKVPKKVATLATTTITKPAMAQTKTVLTQQQCLEMVQIMIHGSVCTSSSLIDTVLTALSS
jgi:hypothetical protein